MPRPVIRNALTSRLLAMATGLLILLPLARLAGAQDAEETQMSSKSPSPQAFDHAPWTEVLSRYVDARGMVDYQGLARDRASFDRYLKSIETTSPRSHPELFPTREEALAFYLNAYNAQVFAGVLQRGPEKKSVWRGLVSGLNFFVRMKITVGGESTNLKKLEEKVILKQFQDPRVHAALNCASIGCPRLPQEAFVPERLDLQLDAAMSEWARDPRHVEVDRTAQTVRLNKIFDWFSSDFLSFEERNGTAKPNQIDYLNRYRSDGGQIPREFAISFLPYDKGINAQ